MAPGGEVKRIADIVLARIIAGAYPMGLRLPAEVELADELSCGRSTVREALQHLATLGVVKSRRGSGAHVLDFRREGTPALLPAYLASGRFEKPLLVVATELLRLRSLLALEAVRLAAEHATVGALSEAKNILGRAKATRDPVEQAMDELDLFRALVCASGVWPAVWLANAYWAPMRETHALLAPAMGGSPKDYAEVMGRLLDLVERGDASSAVKHLEKWLARVDDVLLGRLAGVLGEGEPSAPRREVRQRAAPREKRVTRAKPLGSRSHSATRKDAKP